MPIATCPNCRTTLDVPAELYSGVVRCEQCLEPFEPAAGIPMVRTVGNDLARAKPVRVEPRRNFSNVPRSRAWLYVLLAGCGVIALVCAGSCAGLVQVWRNPPFKPYNAADGSYTAVFPGEPLPITRIDSQGNSIVGVESRRDFPEEQYFIETLNPEDEPKGKKARTPKGVVDEWITRNTGTSMQTDAQKSHHGLEASEATGQLSLMKGNFVVRAVKSGDRIFLIGITGGVMPGSEYVDKYLDGFKPKDADKP